MTVGALERAFLNGYQGGFPLTDRPFARVAETLGTTEDRMLSCIREMLDTGLLTRFGPLFDAGRLGGGLSLSALEVPERDFDAVTAEVNALPQVAHNYRRDHRLNMWFVVATETPEGVGEALREIESRTGLPVYDFPKQREFYVGLWLYLHEDGAIDTIPVPETTLSPARAVDAMDRRLIAATQGGLPVTEEPCETLAEELGTTADQVADRLGAMLGSGIIRRVGAVPNHYRLGLRGNGMTVWDVPDHQAEELGRRVGELDFVSHCYLRPRHPGVWPYNLFAMAHGRDRDEVRSKARLIEQLLGSDLRGHEVLFSSAVLKKSGLRLAA